MKKIQCFLASCLIFFILLFVYADTYCLLIEATSNGQFNQGNFFLIFILKNDLSHLKSIRYNVVLRRTFGCCVIPNFVKNMICIVRGSHFFGHLISTASIAKL